MRTIFTKQTIFAGISTVVLIFFLFLPFVVFAQISSGPSDTLNFSSGPSGDTNFSSGCNQNSGFFTLCNPLGSTTTFCGLIKKLLSALMIVGIPIAMLFLVYAGFLFVWARGNPAGLEKARKNLMYVVIGIGIFLGAWGLGQVVANTINAIQPGTLNSGNSCT